MSKTTVFVALNKTVWPMVVTAVRAVPVICSAPPSKTRSEAAAPKFALAPTLSVAALMVVAPV